MNPVITHVQPSQHTPEKQRDSSNGFRKVSTRSGDDLNREAIGRMPSQARCGYEISVV